MKKTLIIAGAIAALAAPSSALAQDETPSAKQLAQQACKAELAEVGKATFRATYGTTTKKKQKGQNAHRNCVRLRTGEAAEAKSEAKTTCRAERDADAAAFAETYGTNKNNKNAYGKCVSSQSKEAVAEITEDRVNAAQQCKEERGTTDESKEAFREKYGTNKNKKNAFGKCVSAIAKAQQDDQPEA